MSHGSDQRFTLADIAQRVQGTLRGDGGTMISGINTLADAGPCDVTFIINPAYAQQWPQSNAAAAIVSDGLKVADGDSRPLIFVLNAEHASITLLELFQTPQDAPEIGIHPTAIVHQSATIGEQVRIGPYVTIGEHCQIGNHVTLHAGVRIHEHVRIGPGTIVHANTVIRARTQIGRDVIVHQNASLGADGFGYRSSPDNSRLLKVPHIGNVIIEDEVEIGANSCVDRAKFGSTIIGRGTKIDNLCQIGHNVRIGRGCVLAGQVGVAGSAIIGDDCQIGGQVGIGDHVRIGNGVKLAAKSAVMRDVPDGATWGGIPADDAGTVLRQIAAVRKLPELLRRLSAKD
jgi:UDP-3-O-[3-hydroxymyristoyl] glucosamine N-acyltransferase